MPTAPRPPLLAASLLALALACGGKRLPPITAAPEALRTPSTEALILGPGDRLGMKVWRQDDLTTEIIIGPDGTFSLPLVGTVKASGMTWPELKDTITTALSQYYEAPQVSLNIIEVQNQKVFVVGEVKVPSVLQLTGEMSVLEALTLTGGINESSRTDNILLIRGGLAKPELYTVDLSTLFVGGSGAQIVALRRGDILVVPTRTITNAGRYFRDVQTLLAPFLAGSAIYRNALSSGAQGTSSVLE